MLTNQIYRLWLTALFTILLTCRSYALIEGGTGNQPLHDPGWPKGAAQIFNHKGRIAYWVGPPLGGGQWHSECKGDAEVLNEVLKQFASIEGKKRIVVYDGLGYSFWLDPNGSKRGDKSTKIDWVFTVWEPERWKAQKKLPTSLTAIDPNQTEPTLQIAVYTATLRWADVQVPNGIEVIDNRMLARGFKLSDGRVIEGNVVDSADNPLQAKIRIEQIIPREKAGYDYKTLRTIETDQVGHWCIKNFGTEWCRLIAESDGFASRVIGHVRYDRQPGWQSMNTKLAPQTSIQGQVIDETGTPLADVSVALRDLVALDGNRYETVGDGFQKTDANGNFMFTDLPHGKARITGHHEVYFSPGLGQEMMLPGEKIKLTMYKAAKLLIRVEFAGDRGDKQYLANLTPEGGEKIGSWSGSVQVGAENTAELKGVPPGKYNLVVYPNPSSAAARKKSQLVELKGGEVTTVVVKQTVDE